MNLLARVRRPLQAVVLVVVALVVAILLFEEKLIYFPAGEIEITPQALGLRFEDCRLATEDGVRVHGWFLPLEGSTYTVLVCHGNAGNMSHRLDRALLMQTRLGTGVMLFDYRGYGRSEGSPDEQGTYRDGRAAYRFLVSERAIPAQRIVLFGESLGAAVAIQLALEAPARALVVESAFTSIPDMARALYPFLPLPVTGLLRTRYDNLAKISEVHLPLLVLHGTRDQLVPFSQGRRLFEAAGGPKRFHPISGAEHNDTFLTGGEDYWQAWHEFLASLD